MRQKGERTKKRKKASYQPRVSVFIAKATEEEKEAETIIMVIMIIILQFDTANICSSTVEVGQGAAWLGRERIGSKRETSALSLARGSLSPSRTSATRLDSTQMHF